MSKRLTYICDFCGKESESDRNWHKIEVSIKNNSTTRFYDALMCDTCHTNTIDPHPKSILKRLLKLIKGGKIQADEDGII